MMTIAKSEVKNVIAEEAGRVCAVRTQAEVQKRIEEALVDMLQLGTSACSNEIKRASVWFLEMFVLKLFSHEAGVDFMSDCLERWMKTDKFLNAVVKRIVSNPLFVWLVTGFIQQHVGSVIDEFCFTQSTLKRKRPTKRNTYTSKQIRIGRDEEVRKHSETRELQEAMK